MKSQLNYLKHILDECDYLIQESRSITLDEFIADLNRTRAFVRSIEIIGEATKNLSTDLKLKYNHVEWKKIAGTRDRLIHGYFDVDYELIFDVVKNKIPDLRFNVASIIHDIESL